MADKAATVEIAAKSSGLTAQLREARAKFGAFADDVAKIFIDKASAGKSGFFGGGKGLFGLNKSGSMLGVAGGNLISGGVGKAVGAVEDIAKSTFDFNDQLTRLQILSDSTPAQMNAFASSVEAASNATGKNKGEILAAASTYVALTGDMDTARDSIKTWTDVAQATGSTVADISGAAAALKQNMNVGSTDMLDVLGGLAKQGKLGAIELKDLAAQLPNIAPMWTMFKDGGATKGALQLGAALQIVRRGFGGDAGETVTGVQGMLTAFVKNAARFEAAGVKMYDTDGKGGKHLRNVYDIVDSIGKSSLVKDPTKMEKAFGRVEGYRAYLQLVQNRQALEDFSKAGEGAAMIQRDLGTYTTSAAGRTNIAIEKLKNSIAAAFTPERIEKFAAAIERVTDAAAKAFGALDMLINGPSKKQKADEFSRAFVSASEGGEDTNDSNDSQVNTVARMFVESSDVNDYNEKLQAENERRRKKNQFELDSTHGGHSDAIARLASPGDFEAKRDAAKAYLLSNGGKDADFIKFGRTRQQGIEGAIGAATPGAGRDAVYRAVMFAKHSVTGDLTAKDIGKAIATELKEIKLIVHLDGKEVGKGTANAGHHRTDVKR